MSIYVGMDVHRKRSQVAVLDDAGVQQRNRNVPTIRRSWWRSLARCRRAPRSRLRRLPLGLAGRAARGAGTGPASGPPQPRQGDRLGQAQGRQGRCPHLGAAAARRPVARGLDRTPGDQGSAGAAAAPGQPDAGIHRGQEPHPCGAGRTGIPRQTGLWTSLGRVWLAELPATANPACHRRGLPAPCWTVSPNRSRGWSGRSTRSPSPTHGVQALMAPRSRRLAG